MLLYFCLLIIINGAYGEPCSSTTAVSQLHLSLVGEFSVCVMWNSTHEMAQPTVRYFKGKCAMKSEWMDVHGAQRQYPSDGFIYLAKLNNLDSDSTYCYAIGDNCEHSNYNQFRTPSSSKATLAALSDSGTRGNVTYVMENLASDTDVTLVLHPGDLSYGLTENIWDDFGKIIEPVAKEKPYMIIPGNWDVKNSFAIQAFVNRYTMPLITQPPQPATLPLSYYYSFNYSVFHVVMLSSYDPYNSTSPQYRWLESDLLAASVDRVKHPWIVVCFHSPMYSSNSGHGGGDTAFRLAVEPILVKFKVDLILTGHDHGYERTYPIINNIVYDSNSNLYHSPNAPIHILVGTAGASLDSWLVQPAWSAHREASFGYTKIIATRHKLSVIYIRQDLSIGDQFSISKDTPLNLHYIYMVGLVVLFAILPLLLYKGLPDPLRNYLLCHVDDESTRIYNHLIISLQQFTHY